MDKDQILEELNDIRKLINEISACRGTSQGPGLDKILKRIVNLLENVWLGDDE